mgnify:CR=1 FL=1
MSKSDIFSIKYIYGELDPSEEIIFEREIKEDSDLMIEVESLKKTRKKLEDIPVIQPPDHLTKKVFEFSVHHSNSQSRGQSSLLYFSFAASILVVIFFGYMFSLNGNTESRTDILDSGIETNRSELIQQMPANRSNDVNFSPWVDKNDIIHVNDLYNTNSKASFDSIIRTSTQKLTPVVPLEQGSVNHREFHLTGSNK